MRDMTTRAWLRCGVLLLGLVLVTSPAHAETWRHPDAVSDAVSTAYVDGEVVTAPAPENETADITRLDVRHEARRVLVDLHLRELREDALTNLSFRIRTPRASYVALLIQSPDSGTSLELQRGHRILPCSRLGLALRPRIGELQVWVARSCLGEPRWVRVGASFSRWEPAEDGSVEGRLHDDALATGGEAGPDWGPRLYPDPPAPEPALTLRAAYGWQDHRRVGSRLTDGLATLRVGAPRGVVIERVRAAFDGGVRLIGARFAPPDRSIGGVGGTPGWPPAEYGLGFAHTIAAHGAQLTGTGPRESWLLLLGYRVTEPGRHYRPSIRIDYRIGGQRLTAHSRTPGLICAGRVWRDRPCELTDDEMGDLGRAVS